jgi:hypothetical protein
MPSAADAIGIQVVVNGIDALRHIRALDPTSCPPVPGASAPPDLAPGRSGLPRPVDVRYLGDGPALEWAVLALGT